MAFTDDFTGTNGDDVSARTGWDNTGLVGAYKSIVAGTNGLGMAGDSGSDFGAVSCTDQGSADCYVQAELVVFAAASQYFANRMVDKDTWWGFGVFGTGGAGLRLYKGDGDGTVTQIATGQPVSGATYKFSATVNGSNSDLSVEEVGVGEILSSTEPNSDVSGTETRQGIIAGGSLGGDTNKRWDNFEAGAIGGAAANPKGVFGMPLNRPMRGPL